MPIKFGSPLYSKLNKKYWDKEHVSGKPLVIAIHDYHQTGSMVWSRTALSEYLYAKRIRLTKDSDGNKSIIKEDIDFYKYEGKKFRQAFSGFQNLKTLVQFYLPIVQLLQNSIEWGKLLVLAVKISK